MANFVELLKEVAVLKVGQVGQNGSNDLGKRNESANDFIEKLVCVFSKTAKSFVVTSSMGAIAISISGIKDIVQKNPDLFDRIKEGVEWSVLGKRIPLNDDLVSRLPSPSSFYLESQEYRYQGDELFQKTLKAMKIKTGFYDVNRYRSKMETLVPQMERFIEMHGDMGNLSPEMKLKYTQLMNVISKIKSEGYLVQQGTQDLVSLSFGENDMDEHHVQFSALYEMNGKPFNALAEQQKEKIMKYMGDLAYQRDDLYKEISTHVDTLDDRLLNVLSDAWMIASMDEQKAQDFLRHYEHRHVLKWIDFAKIRSSKNPFAELMSQAKSIYLLSRVTNETLVDAFSQLVAKHPNDESVRIFLTDTWPQLTSGAAGKGVDGGFIGPSLYEAALCAADHAQKRDAQWMNIQGYINYVLKDKVNGLSGFNLDKVSKYAGKFEVANVEPKEVSFGR